MKLPSFIHNIFGKASAVTQIIVQQSSQRALWNPDRFSELADQGYSKNTAVYACVNEISKAVGGVPWVLHKKGRSLNSKDSFIEDSPLLDLLNRPNPWQGGASFSEAVMAYLLISGNSYIERVGPNNGPPLELFIHRPDRFKVIPDSKNMVRGYKFSINSNSKDFVNGEILHRKLYNPLHDWYGLSPIQVAAMDIDSDTEAKRWNLNLAKNDMRPPGGFFAKEPLNEDQFNRLKQQLDSEYAGSGNAGKRLLLEGDLDWKQFALNQKDVDWINGMKVSERRIYNIFQVPGELIGDSENKTYSNYKEARKSFYQETILPHLDSFKSDYNNWLTPLFGDNLVLDYDRDSIEAIQQDRNELFQRLSQATWMTINEKRAESGHEEIEGGDVLLIPIGVTPFSTEEGEIVTPTEDEDPDPTEGEE